MLPTLIRRTGEKIPYMYTNPYKASKKWPPDFSKLPPNKQFRLERKYRRRVQLKWARPLWMKSTKVVQMGLIGFTLFYGVLFVDWGTLSDPENPPFSGVRKWFFGMTDSIWTKDGVRRKDGPGSDNAQPSPVGSK